jgi:predicted RND superfamily exporter protein
MTMPLLTSLAEKKPIERRTEMLLDAIDKPTTAKHVFQYTFDWTWSVTQQNTVEGMSNGMAFALPLAFLVLVVVTANYVVALAAIISVCGVVGSVLGVCQVWLGWYLGTGEAIAGVMVIGLAVDYTIHLGHMYVHAGRHEGYATREERFEYAIDKMMGTVRGGAITTCGAGAMMFFTIQYFFTKMAILLTLTIIFSATYSILWFMPLMYWYGPSNEDYDTPFKKWYKDIRNKMKGSQGNSAQPSSVQESDM